MDDFKQNIKGFRGRVRGFSNGSGTCPCCREVKCKSTSRRLARRRLRQADRHAAAEMPDPLDALIAAIEALDAEDGGCDTP